MAEASWPFYGAETNETQFSKWASTLVESGIASGLAIAPGTGMAVTIAIGSAIVRGVFYENNTAAKTLAVSAAPGTAGQTRRDYVILRLDQTANTITALVKAGTANTSGGALPSLTQNDTTWEIALAIITVANGTAAISAAMIDELKPSTGLRVLPYVTADRPTPGAGVTALGLDITAKRLELWNGSSWASLFDFANISGTVPVNQGGTGVTTLKAAREALDIFVQPTAPAHKKGRIWIPGTALD